ncbi:uromodulin-like 1 [Acipenser oxyrinchus oxyrinchus]|uniref:Uromodulin-like 1 n=1 Tax=Acipenser oxyrinchus oxyrinchus TaxID=40147 RepID=A0AAD8G7U8_ACIOX|nr:uromodulin-like 1 [Acipenser oxyrinchus oxyrinchus]
MRAAGVCEEGRITQLWDCRGGFPRGPCLVKPLHLSDLEGKGNGRTDWDLIRVPSKTRAAIVPKSTMSWISRVALILLFSGETRGHSTLFTGYELSLTGYHLCPRTVTKTVSTVVAHQTTHTERSSCGGWLPWKNCLKTHYKTAYRIVETKIIKHSPACCDGYEQVGSYCALPLNRAEEFTSKPGTCPEHKIAVSNQSCEWDIHCPGLQKCCRVNGTALCVSPVCAVAEGRWFYNATVTVKMDFAELDSLDKGLLNHSRLLHSVVTGALSSLDSSVYYIHSYHAGNFKTASQLLIRTSSRVSQENISSELELIVRNIEEVCNVEVQDVDECSLCFSAEGSYDCACSPGFINTTLDRNGTECTADLNTGTVSSNSSTLQENTTAPASWTERNATGLPDFTAVTESSTTNEARDSNATHPPPTRAVEPFSNTTEMPPAPSTIPTQGQSSVAADLTAIAATSQLNSTIYTHSIAEEWITSAEQPVSCALGGALCSALSNVSTTPEDWMLNSTATPNPRVATSPHLMQSTATGFDSTNSTFLNVTKDSTDSPHTNPSWTTTSSPDLSTWSSAISLPLAMTTACYPSPVKNLVVVNVTSLGFYVSWSVDDSPFNPSFEVKLLQGAVQLESAETREPGWAAAGLEAGQLYTVWVIVKLCGSESVAKQEVRTAAEVLEGTARITNLQFNEALSNSSSEEYLNLTQEIQMEIRKSLPEDTLALLSSGEVRLVITSVSSGSVKVHFLLVFTAALHDRIESLSSALLTSLQNSSSYVVDSSSTSIVDFDECSAGEDDCSPHASCVNTWGSYNCCCRDTFRDINPSRPGRSCHDIDECESGNTTCHMNAACQNTIGGYSCSCHNGFSDTDPRNPGRHCADINECASDNNTCHPNSTCHNFPGGYSCACNSGFNDTDPGYPGRQCAETPDTQGSTTAMPLSETPALRETPDTQGSTTVMPLSETPALREIRYTQGSTTVMPLSETPALRETPDTQGSTTVMHLSETPALRETPDTQGSTTVMPLSETPALRETPDTQGSTTAIPLAEAITVSCRAPHITVSVKKAFLSWKSIAESSLYLGTVECNASSSNETHVWLSAVWGKCATQLLHNTSHMTVQTTLFNTHASNIMLLPETVIKLPVRCTYSNDFLISTGYTPSEIENLKGVIEGSGSFLATIQLLNGTVPLPKNYSFSPNDDVLIEVGVNLDSLQVKIILHECWATPSISSTDPTTYMFMRNSCPIPDTYTTVLENGNSTRARVSLRVFSFVDQSVIYLHCRVRVCLESAGTSCKPNCNVRSSGSSAYVEIGQAMWGPIYKSSTDTTQNPSSPYNETGFILLGVFLCALLVVVLAVLMSLHRKRVGHYDFSIKPRQENFTYQVFDT